MTDIPLANCKDVPVLMLTHWMEFVLPLGMKEGHPVGFVEKHQSRTTFEAFQVKSFETRSTLGSFFPKEDQTSSCAKLAAEEIWSLAAFSGSQHLWWGGGALAIILGALSSLQQHSWSLSTPKAGRAWPTADGGSDLARRWGPRQGGYKVQGSWCQYVKGLDELYSPERQKTKCSDVPKLPQCHGLWGGHQGQAETVSWPHPTHELQRAHFCNTISALRASEGALFENAKQLWESGGGFDKERPRIDWPRPWTKWQEISLRIFGNQRRLAIFGQNSKFDKKFLRFTKKAVSQKALPGDLSPMSCRTSGATLRGHNGRGAS